MLCCVQHTKTDARMARVFPAPPAKAQRRAGAALTAPRPAPPSAPAESVEHLLYYVEKADKALYYAKQHGRNQAASEEQLNG